MFTLDKIDFYIRQATNVYMKATQFKETVPM